MTYMKLLDIGMLQYIRSHFLNAMKILVLFGMNYEAFKGLFFGDFCKLSFLSIRANKLLEKTHCMNELVILKSLVWQWHV